MDCALKMILYFKFSITLRQPARALSPDALNWVTEPDIVQIIICCTSALWDIVWPREDDVGSV